jgi:predicted enzyme related to lactoylglutathione lyase
MTSRNRRFTWYELLTTDVAAARAFYVDVVGWSARDASTADFPYEIFSADATSLAGVLQLPEDARKMGATPRWMGYVDVEDVDFTAGMVKRLGGAVYVPPTNSNIGRIAVVADPQTATIGLVQGLALGHEKSVELDAPGMVGWHELLATDWANAFTFYRQLFGWQKAEVEPDPAEPYQVLSVGGQTIGGIFTKRPIEPVPYWLYYFNVEDIDAAAERVKKAGGRVLEGPIEVPEGGWILRCIDPQGAIFALQGNSRRAISEDPTSELNWSASWSGISTKGRLVDKRRRLAPGQNRSAAWL